MSELIHHFADWVVTIVDGLGIAGIYILMTIESSFIPFPSELILIPAGYAIKQGNMNGVSALIAATLGSLTGAYINYFLALKLGRATILRYGKYVFLNEEKFQQVEKNVLTHGNFITFFGRLIFGVRQLISIPAGLVRMPLVPFTLYTSLGAAIWSAILISLGYILGDSTGAVEKSKQIGVWVLVVVAIISIAYYFWLKPKKKAC